MTTPFSELKPGLWWTKGPCPWQRWELVVIRTREDSGALEEFAMAWDCGVMCDPGAIYVKASIQRPDGTLWTDEGP